MAVNYFFTTLTAGTKVGAKEGVVTDHLPRLQKILHQPADPRTALEVRPPVGQESGTRKQKLVQI